MKRKITKQEVIDSTLLSISELAEDARITSNELIEEGNIDALFQSAEDLCSQAHDIYRLVVTLQTLEEMGNLAGNEANNG